MQRRMTISAMPETSQRIKVGAGKLFAASVPSLQQLHGTRCGCFAADPLNWQGYTISNPASERPTYELYLALFQGSRICSSCWNCC